MPAALPWVGAAISAIGAGMGIGRAADEAAQGDDPYGQLGSEDLGTRQKRAPGFYDIFRDRNDPSDQPGDMPGFFDTTVADPLALESGTSYSDHFANLAGGATSESRQAINSRLRSDAAVGLLGQQARGHDLAAHREGALARGDASNEALALQQSQVGGYNAAAARAAALAGSRERQTIAGRSSIAAAREQIANQRAYASAAQNAYAQNLQAEAARRRLAAQYGAMSHGAASADRNANFRLQQMQQNLYNQQHMHHMNIRRYNEGRQDKAWGDLVSGIGDLAKAFGQQGSPGVGSRTQGMQQSPSFGGPGSMPNGLMDPFGGHSGGGSNYGVVPLAGAEPGGGIGFGGGTPPYGTPFM